VATKRRDTHPDHRSEQSYIDRAYERLEELCRDSATRLESVLASPAEPIVDPDPYQAPGPQHQLRYERDIAAAHAAARLQSLELGGYALCFGRVDREDGERLYLGRLAVPDRDHDPLVIDWRAPAAEAFYRATGLNPHGLVLRRHLVCEGQKLIAIEDETFSEEGDLGLAGPGALLAALERKRTGKMRDIVSTVQREQDEIIRAEVPGVLVVQGGPGTGKTAVALHRAAYLLFTHRARLGRVAVIGPNPVFLGYIDQVLPALGESGAVLATPGGVTGRGPARGSDSMQTARVKGDARMAAVIERAVRDRERSIRQDVALEYDDPVLDELKLRVGRQDVSSALEPLRRAAGTHNDRRPRAEKALLEVVYNAYVAAARSRARGLKLPRGIRLADMAEEREMVLPRLAVEPSVVRLIDLCWPVVRPEQLLHDLFGSRALLASACRGVLELGERDALQRPWSDEVAWTEADLALLDEAFVHLGPLEPRDEEDWEREVELPLFGHIVVDEAQDLSPMQLRVLARRTVTGSMTLVGDLAQATGECAAPAWDEVVSGLGSRSTPRLYRLSINYRTPSEAMELANRVLRVAAPELEPPESVRESGLEPEFRAVRADRLAGTVASVARSEMRRARPGTVAVICAPSQREELAAALEGTPFADASEGLGSPVTLVPVNLAKGLEFDAVIVAEPARIVSEAAQGLRALYVALTRTTGSLTIVHSEPLPDALIQ
jgi:DNA helicase IV